MSNVRMENVWKIIKNNPTTDESEQVGLMLLYVDDNLIASLTKLIQMTLAALKAQWLMTETGIISRDGAISQEPSVRGHVTWM